jgi:hypothetical protein
LEKSISEAIPAICQALSQEWLGGRTAFANERRLPSYALVDALDSPNLMEIARHALPGEETLLSELAQDIRRSERQTVRKPFWKRILFR